MSDYENGLLPVLEDIAKLFPIKSRKKRSNPNMVGGVSNPNFPGFKPGQITNPLGAIAGRAPGPNNATIFAMQLLEDNAAEIAQVMINKAKAGDITAGRLCLQMSLPTGRLQRCKFALSIPDSP
jgi:hypothetical protein